MTVSHRGVGSRKGGATAPPPMKSGQGAKRGQLFATFAQKLINFGNFQRYFSYNCLVLPSTAAISAVQLSECAAKGRQRPTFFAPFGPFAKKIINFGHFQRYFSDNCVVLPSAAKLFSAQGRKRANFSAHIGPLF